MAPDEPQNDVIDTASAVADEGLAQRARLMWAFAAAALAEHEVDDGEGNNG